MGQKISLKDEELRQIHIDSVKSLFNVSPLHAVECLRTADEIIESLDDKAILEIYNGSEKDIDKVLNGMLGDIYSTLYTGKRDVDFMPKYPENLSENIEEILRCNNLTYFITSVLPDFQMSWHHLEWGDLVHHHNKLCIEAARDHGKCWKSGTYVLMADGTTRKVEDVKVGEYLMGVDSTPRLVTATHRGKDEHMYRIDQSKGDSYTVNSRHTMSLVNSKQGGELIDIDIPTLLYQYGKDYYEKNLFGVRIDYKNKKNNQFLFLCDDKVMRAASFSEIKITDVGPGEYVSITTDGDHRFLLADGTVTHNSYYFSNAYAIWQLYRYSLPKTQQYSRRPSKSNSNRGFLFSFSLQQAVDLIEILKGTIEGNEDLRERLMPSNTREGAWASTNIVCKNGARLTGKGFGSSVRGAHPYWIIVDDGLKDNVIYSQLQRQKSIDYFHSVIMNMLVPGGQIVVVGTPFHANDLYGDLKTKKGWFVIEYPAIFPNGKILWPQRWSFKDLIDKKNTQGNIIFSRENLCRPIVSDSSIFPLSILKRSLVRMENYTLVRNRDDFPIKFGKVVTGADFAISSNVGADYYCYTTFGVDEDNGMWLLDIQIGKGRSYDEQLQILKGINVRFRPDVMVFESNVFQQIFTEGATKYGMPVVPHNTGTEKNDLSKGWIQISVLFERSMMHIPIGDKRSQDAKDVIFEQLGSVAFTDKGGLASVSDHDDVCSSMWLAMLGRNIASTGGKFSFI